jgi:hypothetical protein
MDFGIKHLKRYVDYTVNGKKLIDEVIDTDNWYKQNLTHCIFGDVVMMLGTSLGSLGELAFGFYLYKLLKGDKPGVKIKQKIIHPEVRAGTSRPISLIVYMPFIKEKLSTEIEAYVGNIHYVESASKIKPLFQSQSFK